jgi:hypothetical protein
MGVAAAAGWGRAEDYGARAFAQYGNRRRSTIRLLSISARLDISSPREQGGSHSFSTGLQ